MSRYDDGYGGGDRGYDRGYYGGGGERERAYAPPERGGGGGYAEERRGGGGADYYERERAYERRPAEPREYDRGYDRGYPERPPPEPRGYYDRPPEPRRGGYERGGYERGGGGGGAAPPPPAAGAYRRVYIGNVPRDARRGDLEAEFSRFGRVESTSVFAGDGGSRGSFGFVEFSDPRDADAAIRAMDGRDFMGARLKVEISKGKAREPAPAGPGNSASTGTFKKSDFRVLVTGLGANVGWRELKDFGRDVGRVHYTAAKSVGAERVGVIEFVDQESMDKALATLVRCCAHPGEPVRPRRPSSAPPRRSLPPKFPHRHYTIVNPPPPCPTPHAEQRPLDGAAGAARGRVGRPHVRKVRRPWRRRRRPRRRGRGRGAGALSLPRAGRG